MLPLVTIAIPTFNRADSYLSQALQSALKQTYPNLEILVSDNCSTDQTESLLTGIADPRIRYFRHETNIGANNNVNFCIEQAKGEYLLILHDDDAIDRDFVETCVKAGANIPDIGMIRTGMRWIDSHNNVLGQALNRVGGLPIEGFIVGWFSGMTPMHLCCTLFNTDKLRRIGGLHSKHNVYDDVIAEVKLAGTHNRVDVWDVKASFRHHLQQFAEKRQITGWCEDSLILLDTMCALVPAPEVERVHRAGVKHFLRGNYRRARRIRPFMSRLAAYGTILEYFEYPVLQFAKIVFSLNVSRFVRPVKKMGKKLLENMPALKLRIDACRTHGWGSQR